MKISGIIGFILVLLADVFLFVESMNLPAGSSTSKILLIFAVLTLIVSILYFIAGLKTNKILTIIASALFVLMPILAFFAIRLNIQDDIHEFGKYFIPDSALGKLLITMLLEVVFGITGIIISIVSNHKSKQVNLSR